MTIGRILAGNGRAVVTVEAACPIAEAVRLLAERRIGAVPVMRAGAVAGIFSERDVIHAVAADGAAALSRRVDEHMTAPAVTVSPGEPVLAALALMTRRRIRHLPVMDGERMVGLVSIGDLVKYRIEAIEADAAAMREYIQAG